MPTESDPGPTASAGQPTLALAVGVSRFVTVARAKIHYRVFNPGDTTKPGLLFVHGLWAHSHWWDHMIPSFVNQFRVAAMDFGGMGDSEGRSIYTARGFGEEIVSVLRDADMSPATIVAHSFGGTPTAFACHDSPDAVARAVIIDSRMFILGMQDLDEREQKQMKVSKKIYDNIEDAVDRYRLIPPGGPVDPMLIRHIAIHGLRKEQGGWSWKFDAAIHPLLKDDPDRIAPAGISTPMDYIYGQDSDVVSAEMAAAIVSYLPGCNAPIAVADSNHHILLEQPQKLISLLQSILNPPPEKAAQNY